MGQTRGDVQVQPALGAKDLKTQLHTHSQSGECRHQLFKGAASMFRRNLNRRLIIAVFVAVVGSLGMTTEGKGQTWSFDKDEIGRPPVGFEFAVTANKQPGKWIIVKDGENQVLAQVDRDKTERRFAMALAKNSYKDLKISVKAKPVAGDVEMVAGLVWRYKDADNYYVARWNTDSVRVDRVVKGERQLMTPSEIKITLPAKAWHTLTVEHRGEDIKVFVGKEKVFEGKDKAYTAAGRTGVWIKADSLTYFDDLRVEELK